MYKLEFPSISMPHHSALQDVHHVYASQRNFGQRAADTVAQIVGSWYFIIIQSLLLILWAILNSIAFVHHWDPYPFILMNLVLSTQAAFTAPIIMMSQNRQSALDRLEAHNDYLVNQKAEVEIRVILQHMEAQNTALQALHHQIADLQAQLALQSKR